ncbi:MAG: glycosyltransferase family 2 protein [Candidatus Coproplasma sp.]
MKIISITVPCYNSQNYMEKCVDSLLTGGDDVEIIIVNDGSTDGTLEIAKRYEKQYPSIVKVIDKPNGGHGSGVNAGLKIATGLYYKVVDSDDWLDENAFQKLLSTIKTHISEGTPADLYVTNFIYDKVCEQTQFVRNYRKNLPVGQFFNWEKVKRFKTSSVLMMHSLLYRTEKLRESNTVLPEHTFYVDNIYAYKPLPFMQKMFYLDIDLYHYFIGREDQSVNINNITKRYRQQIKVMKELLSAYSYEQIKAFPKGLSRYMLHNLSVIMVMSLMFITAGKDELDVRREYLDGLWDYLKVNDKKLFKYLCYRSYSVLVNWLPFRLQGKVTLLGYRFFRRRLKCS